MTNVDSVSCYFHCTAVRMWLSLRYALICVSGDDCEYSYGIHGIRFIAWPFSE